MFGPDLFQHDSSLVHNARIAKTWFVQFSLEELDLPAQSSDLDHIQHLLDEPEVALSANISG